MSRNAHKVPNVSFIDFAPGEKHILVRKKNKNFYAPELFHLAPSIQSGKSHPLLMKDIFSCKTPVDIYGFAGIFASSDKYILVNNHPIRTFRIQGKMTGEYYKSFENKPSFIIAYLDDSSGEIVPVKIKEALYLQAGLKPSDSYGMIIEITGYLQSFNQTKEVVAINVEIKGRPGDLDIEIQFLREALDFRKEFLMKPWVYHPEEKQNVNEFNESNVKHTKEHYDKKKLRDTLRMSDPIIEEVYDLPDSVPVNRDSFKKRDSKEPKAKKRKLNSSTENPSQNFGEVIDLTIEEEILSSSQPFNRSDCFISSQQEEEPSSQPAVKILSDHKLKFALMKWMIKRNDKFRLHEVYKSFTVARLLNGLSDIKVLQQNISQMTELDPKLRKLEIRRMIFHEARHYFTENNLMSCSKRQSCQAVNLIKLKNHIEKCLLLIKSVKESAGQTVVFDCDSYMRKYNLRYNVYLEPNLISDLINWLLFESSSEKNWILNEKRLQWTYCPKINTTKKVTNKRTLSR